MDYIRRRYNYFMTETGAPWAPIGYNESFTWDQLSTDPESHFIKLSSSGVTCIRMMFEYAQTKDGLLELSIGEFNPKVVSIWKTLFNLAEKYNIRFLMSPYDTYWQWQNWNIHPYNSKNGGFIDSPSRLLTDPKTIEIHKQRFKFLIENFSASGVIFGWDLWNEIHPACSQETDEGINDYISVMAEYVRKTEIELHGKAHLLTCSFYAPDFIRYKHLKLLDPIFRHPSLDFCSVHLYDDKTISDPRNTVEPAIKIGQYVKDCIDQIKDGRPFLDTEHGPVKTYIDKNSMLLEEFDNEYFSNIAWAHLASGGAGVGMRWPYRYPHGLSDGMLQTLDSVNKFSSLINWNRFNRFNISNSVLYNNQNNMKVFACGTESKFLLFILRLNPLDEKGMYKDERTRPTPPLTARVTIPNVVPGNYKIISWKEDVQQTSMVMQDTEKAKVGVNLTFGLSLRRCLIIYAEKS